MIEIKTTSIPEPVSTDALEKPILPDLSSNDIPVTFKKLYILIAIALLSLLALDFQNKDSANNQNQDLNQKNKLDSLEANYDTLSNQDLELYLIFRELEMIEELRSENETISTENKTEFEETLSAIYYIIIALNLGNISMLSTMLYLSFHDKSPQEKVLSILRSDTVKISSPERSLFHSLEKRKKTKKHIEIIITTVGSDGVMPSLKYNIQNVQKVFPNSIVHCVVEEGCSNINTLAGLGANVIVVPSNYQTKFAHRKARAQEYVIRNAMKDDTGYIFLDDDSTPLDDTILYEIDSAEALGYKVANCVLENRRAPNSMIVPYIIDGTRNFHDLTLYRATTGALHQPLIGLHGEGTYATGETFKKIGYDYPSSQNLAEDMGFAVRAIESGIKTWQSRTRISILSPKTISDFYKQRDRWTRGVWQAFEHLPIQSKTFVALNSFFWKTSTLNSLMLAPVWYFYGFDTLLSGLMISSSALFLSPYILNIISLKNEEDWKYKWPILLPILPIILLYEQLVPWYSLSKIIKSQFLSILNELSNGKFGKDKVSLKKDALHFSVIEK